MHCWWEYKLVGPLWKTVRRFLKELKVALPYDPIILILGIYPKKMKIKTGYSTLLYVSYTSIKLKFKKLDEEFYKLDVFKWYFHSF